jgi:hypothetical protein
VHGHPSLQQHRLVHVPKVVKSGLGSRSASLAPALCSLMIFAISAVIESGLIGCPDSAVNMWPVSSQPGPISSRFTPASSC